MTVFRDTTFLAAGPQVNAVVRLFTFAKWEPVAAGWSRTCVEAAQRPSKWGRGIVQWEAAAQLNSIFGHTDSLAFAKSPKMLNVPQQLSLLEIIVFDTVAFQTVPMDILAHNAMMRHSKPPPLETWENLVARCIDKEWLRCLDVAALEEIRTCLADVELVCDDEAMPRVGDIDFTPAGAQLYKAHLSESAERWWKDRLGRPAARVVSRPERNRCEVEFYMVQPTTIPDALYGTGEGWAFELARCPVISATEPEVVGGWCSRWWNQHPAGYRLRAVICSEEAEQ